MHRLGLRRERITVKYEPDPSQDDKGDGGGDQANWHLVPFDATTHDAFEQRPPPRLMYTPRLWHGKADP